MLSQLGLKAHKSTQQHYSVPVHVHDVEGLLPQDSVVDAD